MILNNEPSTLEMTICEELEQDFKGAPFFLEIEMLQGKREVKPDGRIHYEMDIDDPAKVGLLKQFILRLMSNPIRQNQN